MIDFFQYHYCKPWPIRIKLLSSIIQLHGSYNDLQSNYNGNYNDIHPITIQLQPSTMAITMIYNDIQPITIQLLLGDLC